MSAHFIVRCIDCGHPTPFLPTQLSCPKCGGTWKEAEYDYKHLAHSLPLSLPGRPFDLWRYRELLPIRSPNPALSLGEGGTPLIKATNLGMMLGCSNIFIKDERQGPTASFKDRQAAVTIAALKEAGITELVIASTGNVAISYSAYAARAGIKLYAFLTSLVPASKMREVALYGTQVIKVTGSYDQAKKVAAEFAKQKNIYRDPGAMSVPTIEAMKTVAFEISEQLTGIMGPPFDPNSQRPSAPWRSPDWYIQSVSGGPGPYGVMRGYEELSKLGMISSSPKFGLLQSEGCAPMVHAWKQNKETAVPIQSPRTLIATLATGDPGRTYTILAERMRSTFGGAFEDVSDKEAFRAMHILAKMEGISVEPAAGVAFAGLIKLVRAGVIKSDEIVVINCTGHTMPIERNILGDRWARNVVLSSQTMEETPEEGLLSALSKVATDRFPRIAIIDDNADVRRLIRRILQSQGSYTIFEADNGRSGIELVMREKPNLVILDLMMPEVDGFAVMDALQNDPETTDIPIIVVTAKELTTEEKKLLNGHIQTLMQKGDFMSDDLMDEIRSLL
jgi:threonine synthase